MTVIQVMYEAECCLRSYLSYRELPCSTVKQGNYVKQNTVKQNTSSVPLQWKKVPRGRGAARHISWRDYI